MSWSRLCGQLRQGEANVAVSENRRAAYVRVREHRERRKLPAAARHHQPPTQPEAALRIGFLAITLTAGAVLAGCTMAPVHGGAMAQSSPALAYAEPNSRLEQVVYQELALRLGQSSSPSASLVTVSVSASGGAEALSDTVDPNTLSNLTVTARMTVSPRDGSATEPITLTRSASAQYTTNAQALSAQEARNEAEERAARAVAESLRLAYLASLVRS